MTALGDGGGFDHPNADDFLRHARRIVTEALNEAVETKMSIDRLSAFDASAGKRTYYDRVDDALRSHHIIGLQDIAKLVVSYHSEHGHGINDLIEIAGRTMTHLTEEIIEMMRPSKYSSSRGIENKFVDEISAEYRTRLDDYLRDLRIGYVAGKNLRPIRPNLRERSLRILQAAYEQAAVDVELELEMGKLSSNLGLTAEETRSGIAYLVKVGLLERKKARRVLSDTEDKYCLSAAGIAEIEDALSTPGRSTDHFPGSITAILVGSMSNNSFVTGQAGAVGPHAHAHDMTFQQIWHQSALDLPAVADELARLRAALRAVPDDSIEWGEAVGAVSAAEKAARAGDGPTMLGRLKPVGRWLLTFANDLKVPAAMEAIKAALGGS